MNIISRTSFIHEKAKLEEPVRIYSQCSIDRNCEIGKYTYIRPYTYTTPNVKIGRYCSIADYVILGATMHPTDWFSTHPFQYEKSRFKNSTLYEASECEQFKSAGKTIIGHDVWIGSKAIIVEGVKIGNGAIIGSGAIITKDVPPYAVVVGNNRLIKYRFSEQIILDLEKIQWWDLPEDIIAKLPFKNIEKCIEILNQHAQV